ncbi:two-component system sensor histidine kinase CreC [Rariglobus hedericola]|uniref:histidine kinase n=1 Tax=Rariglobus hedericola TaxID=2597822 RepID=A0A556QS05_9BACT|nr:two-component system sensor histidine kinase CreC [Rariglobus hedericola]TSJ79426.1 two-component system sensor histidine kinase CreC [Rariglobus hedericola]
MTIRTRILLVYLLLIGGSYLYLVSWILEGIRPRYLESMEESLVDTAALLASVVETSSTGTTPDAAQLRTAVDGAHRRQLDALIYGMRKTSIDLRVYVTDAQGIVLYDSDAGHDEGVDYSQWRDVARTLAGSYGARATRDDPDDESSLGIYVAAPIRSGDAIIGVLAVGKPTRNINELVAVARTRVLLAGLIGGVLVISAGIAFSVWLTTPLEKLTAYARAVRDGRPATLPRLAGREVGDLRRAFEEMRAALEGKDYVERYTQTLAHEIKAPLSAIRGAAELLAEDADMPPDQRAKFLANLRSESARIQQIVDKLLQLAALEARKHLSDVEPVDLNSLVREVASFGEPTRTARGLTLILPSADTEKLIVKGEKFLLTQALSNLLQNAAEFTPAGGTLTLSLTRSARHAVITLDDTGTGIADYALPQVFDRFYSLPRPAGGAKSTGLGLSFVREIAHLHGGEITVANRPDARGCRAVLTLPV